MDLRRLRKSMMTAAVVCLVCAANVMRIFNHSSLRVVDALALIGFGIAVGAYISNAVLYFRAKKQAASQP